jgi:hypothetical protein
MISIPTGRKVPLATIFVFLAASGGIFDGIISTFEGIFKAIADFFSAIGSALSGLFSKGSQDVSHASSQTYSTTLHFVSDAKSYVSQAISHTFTFSNLIKSVNVSLTIHNAASMRFRQIVVDFHVAGQTFSIPISNPNTGPDITVDQLIPLSSPLTVVGVTADIAGTLCGASCSNLTFTPSADLMVSVPP